MQGVRCDPNLTKLNIEHGWKTQQDGYLQTEELQPRLAVNHAQSQCESNLGF